MRRPPRRRASLPSATARTVSALAVLGVLVAGLAGCGSDDPREGCGWMETQTSTPDADSTVILVDGSKSVRGAASGTRGLDYGRVVGDLLDKKDEKGEVISIGTFGGPAGQVEWTVERRPADWKRSNPNPDNQEQNRQDANRCLKDDITEAQQKAPADGGTDVLAALAAGADMFEGVQGVRRLLVLSDGLATTGCADLRSARFGSPQELDSIVSVCAAPGKFGELPDLRGAEVTFVGLGRSAGGQPAANSAQRAWLGELWKALCERAGAARGSCTSSNTPVGKEKESDRATTGSVPDDPVVPYGDGTSRTYALSGEALFDSNSAQVLPAAVPMLTTLAATARTTPSLERVLVDGYVDPRGGSGNNQSLSQARADAVAKVLVDHGVPESRVESHGRGLSPGCPTAAATESMSREQRLQCDRRVNVEIIGK
ncbi:OmpA family protein [Streptomyces sp. NBC_01294]|uniref:OmpA family protein n=1 Tax=Streptomyces sp. NBC_01294 TaxID=2903815 RepID=UPI002DD91E94|nr:OmpA family protein [Streptomyces sp. NBC_01294]WRZ61011.1 OmpA family protein [Streptomyces sp. NBC_01294]